MADVVELIPMNDELIFEAWESGKSVRAVAREFALSVAEVERILDRCLPAFDARNQLRAYKRELARLEVLASEFYAIARRDKSTDHAHIFARLNERLAAMRGWTSVNIRCDPTVAEIAEKPTSHQKIREAIFRLAGRTPPPLADGNNGSGAVDAPSPSDDNEPSR